MTHTDEKSWLSHKERSWLSHKRDHLHTGSCEYDFVMTRTDEWSWLSGKYEHSPITGILATTVVCRSYAGRRTKFATGKGPSIFRTLLRIRILRIFFKLCQIKPSILMKRTKLFPANFSSIFSAFYYTSNFLWILRFYYTSNSFLTRPINTSDRKTCPFREILSQRIGRGEDRVK